MPPIAFGLGLPPEVEGKFLLLKLPCTTMHPETPELGTGLNVPSLRTSSHGTRKCHESFQRREAVNCPTQL